MRVRRRSPAASLEGITSPGNINLISSDSSISIVANDTTDEIDLTVIGGGGAPAAHKDTHKSGGSDAFAAADLLEAVVKRLRETSGPTTLTVGSIADGEFLKRSGAGIVGASVAAGTHAPTHQNGGADEISVTGLSGLLADPQTPTTHKDTHKSGGSDAFTSTDLLEAIVKRLRETSGPTDLTLGAVTDKQILRRNGSTIVGMESASESPEWVGIGKIVTMTNLDGIWTAPFDGKIRAVAFARRIAGSSGFTRVDVNKNLGTIFTTSANRPSITAASGDDQAVITTLMDITTFTQGDHFTVDIDDAETGSAKDARVLVIVEYN